MFWILSNNSIYSASNSSVSEIKRGLEQVLELLHTELNAIEMGMFAHYVGLSLNEANFQDLKLKIDILRARGLTGIDLKVPGFREIIASFDKQQKAAQEKIPVRVALALQEETFAQYNARIAARDRSETEKAQRKNEEWLRSRGMFFVSSVTPLQSRLDHSNYADDRMSSAPSGGAAAAVLRPEAVVVELPFQQNTVRTPDDQKRTKEAARKALINGLGAQLGK